MYARYGYGVANFIFGFPRFLENMTSMFITYDCDSFFSHLQEHLKEKTNIDLTNVTKEELGFYYFQ